MHRLAGCVLAFVALFIPALAVTGPANTLVVENAWVRKPPGADSATAYMVLRNTGTQPAVIVGVESPIAAHAMIHETTIANGQSRMRMHEKLVLAPGQRVTLAPGRLHVMLSHLEKEPVVGQTVPLVLHLADGGQVYVSAVVRPLDAQ